MKTIEVHRAQDTDQPVEPVTLVIGDPIPDESRGDLRRLRRQFTEEAALVYSALKRLPGGTLDALLVRLLEEKRSHHVVQWDSSRTHPEVVAPGGTDRTELLSSAVGFFLSLAESGRAARADLIAAGHRIATDASKFIAWVEGADGD